MPVKIKSTSGSVTLDAQNVSGDQTLTVPSQSGATLQTTADTITSSRLSGALPAISGASLTNLPAGGVDGIVSSANATAITINSSEQVGVGLTAPNETLHAYKTSSNGAGLVNVIKVQTDTNSSTGDGSAIAFHGKLSSTEWGFGKVGGANSGANYGGALEFHTNAGNGSGASVAYTKQLTITHDGRGLSQFTAKAWVNFNAAGAIQDSHNISSVSNPSTGRHQPNFANNMTNTNYAVIASDGYYGLTNSEPPTHGVSLFNIYTYNSSFTAVDAAAECVVFGD